MYKMFIPVSFAVLLLIGAGCTNNSSQTASRTAAPNSPTSPQPAPANGQGDGPPNAMWPDPGSWSTVSVTTSTGTVAQVTRLAFSFTAGGTAYDGVEMTTSTANYGGRTGTVAIFWRSNDRIGSSTQMVATLPVPGSPRTVCSSANQPDLLESLRLTGMQFYGNQQNLGWENVTLSNGKTYRAYRMQGTLRSGDSYTTLYNPEIPFSVVRANPSAGGSTELVDYGTSGKDRLYTNAQITGACAL